MVDPMKWLAAFLLVLGCTKKNPAACCENELECTRLGLAADDLRPCESDGTACVANTCQSTGCDGDEDCTDPSLAHCVSGACTAGCDGNEDCTDPDFPLCTGGVCNVDCEAREGRIVFHSDRNGSEDLVLMFADGFGPSPLVSSAAIEREPRISADGTKVAFLSDDDADLDVYVLVIGAQTSTNVSNNTVGDGHVQWSPDQTRIAFDSTTAPLSAHTVAIAGSDLRDLIGPAGGDNAEPAWNPGSDQLVFRNQSLVIQTVTGTTLVTIPAQSDPQRSPAWSPTGSLIAYVEAGASNGLFMVAPSGMTPTKYLDSADALSDLTWSPDGTKLVFVRNTAGNKDVWSIDSDGSNLKPLTTSTGDDIHPRWSPDGTSIVFESRRDGNSEVYRMKADGSNPVNLTNNPAADQFPDWGKCPP
jgi:TolB protein